MPDAASLMVSGIFVFLMKMLMMWQATKLTYTADDLPKLYAAGILQADHRIELLDGEIYYISPINFPHAQCVRKLNDLFNDQIRKDYYVDTQNLLVLNKTNIVQPDIAIYTREDFLQLTQHPHADMVKLLIEVSDSTYHQDKQTKLPKYAQAGISQVWIVKLADNKVEVYEQPHQKQYLTIHHYLIDQPVPTPFGFNLKVSDFLS